MNNPEEDEVTGCVVLFIFFLFLAGAGILFGIQGVGAAFVICAIWLIHQIEKTR